MDGQKKYYSEVVMDNINEMLIYRNKDGEVIVDAIYKDETLWLTQKGMAKVFDCSTDNIGLMQQMSY